MFKKALIGLIVAVVLGSTALVFAQFRGPQPGPGRRRPRPGGPGGGPAIQLSSITDIDVSGNYIYMLTGDWLHQVRLGQSPNLMQSADVSEALREAQGGPGQVSVSSDARVRVTQTNEVVVLTNGVLVVYSPTLTRAQVRPLGPALREAMQVQQRARAEQRSRNR